MKKVLRLVVALLALSVLGENTSLADGTLPPPTCPATPCPDNPGGGIR
jgi:hypothetical protein